MIVLRYRGALVNRIIAIAAAEGLIQGSSDPDFKQSKSIPQAFSGEWDLLEGW